MTGLARDTHPSSKLFDNLAAALDNMSESEKKDLIKKANGVFELVLKNKEGNTESWIVDMKKKGEVVKGGEGPKSKPDVTITMADEVFQQLVDGKLNGQKAFMGGKLKVKGNIQLATRLDVVLKNARAKL